jgi:hypothetical protein
LIERTWSDVKSAVRAIDPASIALGAPLEGIRAA